MSSHPPSATSRCFLREAGLRGGGLALALLLAGLIATGWMCRYEKTGRGAGTAAHLITLDASRPWLELGGGVVISLLLSGLTLSLANTRNNARKLAVRLTADLRQSEEKFAKVFRSAPVLIVLSDMADGKCVDVNEEVLRVSGYTRQEVIGRTAVELGWITTEARARMVREVMEHGRVDAREMILRTKSGEGRTGLVRCEQTIIGDRLCLLTITVDINARKLAEEQQRRNKESLAITLQSIGDAVIATDAAGLITRMNPTAERLTGWSLAEASGRPLTEVFNIVHAQTRESILNPMQRVMEYGAAVGLANHASLLARGGGEYQIADNAAPIRDSSGKIVGVVLVFSDVTEKYRVQQLLARTAGQLERTGEMARVGGWELDLRTMELFWSRETCRIHELEPPVAPALAEAINYYTPEARPKIQAAVQKAIADGTSFDLELPLVTAKGKAIWVRAQGSAVMKAGKAIQLHGACQDITQRKFLESQLLQAQKMEAVGLLAGGVAHDFNNILAVVLMYLGLLQNDPALSHETQRSLKQLENEVRRGASLTRQLLAFSRQEAMAPALLNVNSVVEELMKMLHRLLGEQITITHEEPHRLMLTEGDEGMLEQVMMNLCINARDAMPRGGHLKLTINAVEIDAASPLAHAEARPGRFLCLAIADTGSGMDAHTIQRIFEPFFTTKEVGKGTGLGLSIVHGIVKQHRGWIEVESALGQGTTFRVYLPHSETPGLTLPDANVPFPTALGRGETILLTEDEASLRAVMAMVLRQHGYTVIEAGNGPQAIDQWQHHRGEIALLIADMIMPGGMDGVELIETLQQMKPDLNVVGCTGYNEAIEESHFSGDPRITLLRKPFDMSLLLTTPRQVIDRN